MKRQEIRSTNYGPGEIISNAFFLLKTKVLFPTARLIRFPIIVRGRRWIDFGKKLTTGRRCRIEVNGKFKKPVLVFGENVNIGDDVRISAAEGVFIGNRVLMGSRVLVLDNSHGIYKGNEQDVPETAPDSRAIYTAPVVIEDNVWIGDGAVILKGVTVGYGSIVGSNAVVTKDVPAKSIVAGSPAKVIKEFDDKTKTWVRNRSERLS